MKSKYFYPRTLLLISVVVSSVWVIASKTPEDPLDADVTKIEKLTDDVLLDPAYRETKIVLPNGSQVGNLLLETNGPRDRVVALNSKNLDQLVQHIDQLRLKINSASDERVKQALKLGEIKLQAFEVPEADASEQTTENGSCTSVICKPGDVRVKIKNKKSAKEIQQTVAANLVLLQFSKIIKRYIKLQSRLYLNYVRNAHKRTGFEHEYSPDVYEKLNLSLHPTYYLFLMLKNQYLEERKQDPDKLSFNFRHDESSDDLTVQNRHIVGLTPYEKTNFEQVALLEVPSQSTVVNPDLYAKAIQFLAIRERITNHWGVHRMVRSLDLNAFETDDLLLGKGPKNLLSFRESKQNRAIYDYHRDLWTKDHNNDFAALRTLLAKSALLQEQTITATQISNFRYEFVKTMGGARPEPLPKEELYKLEQLASQIDTAFVKEAKDTLQTTQLPGDDFSPISLARRVTRARLVFIKNVLTNDALAEAYSQGLNESAGHDLDQKAERFAQLKLSPALNKIRPTIYQSVYKALLSKEADEVMAQNKRIRLNDTFAKTRKHIESGARAIHALKSSKLVFPSELDPAELPVFEGRLMRNPAKGRMTDLLAPTSVSHLRQFYNAKLRTLSMGMHGFMLTKAKEFLTEKQLPNQKSKDLWYNHEISKIAVQLQKEPRIIHAMQDFFSNLEQAMGQLSQTKIPPPKDVIYTDEQESPLSLVVLGVASASVKNLINDLVRSRKKASEAAFISEINTVKRGIQGPLIAKQDQVKVPYQIEHLKPFGAAKNYNEEDRIVDLYIQAMSILNLGEFVQSRITNKKLSKTKSVTNTPFFIEQHLNRIAPESIDFEKVDFAQQNGFNPARAMGVRNTISRQMIKSVLDQRLMARIMIEEALSSAPVLAQRSSDEELESEDLDSDQALIKNTVLEKMIDYYQPASQFVVKTKFDKNAKTEVSISKGSNQGYLDQKAAFKSFVKAVYLSGKRLQLQVIEAIQAQPFAPSDRMVGLGVFGLNGQSFTKTDRGFRKIFHTIPGVRRVLASQDQRFAKVDELFIKATRTKTQRWLEEKFNPILDAMAPIFLIMLLMIPLMLIIYWPIITAGVSGVIAAGGTAGIVQSYMAAAATATPYFASQMAAVSTYMSSLGLLSFFGSKTLIIKAGFGLASEYLLQYLFFGQLALMYHVNYIQLPHQLQYQMSVSQTLVEKDGIEPAMGASDLSEGYKSMADGKSQTIHSAVMLGLFSPMIAMNMISRTKNFFGTKSRGAVNTVNVNKDNNKILKDITTPDLKESITTEGPFQGTMKYAKEWYQSQRDLGLKTALKPGVSPDRVSPLLRGILDEHVVTTKKYDELFSYAIDHYLQNGKKFLKRSQELAIKPENKPLDEMVSDLLSKRAFEENVNSKDINQLKQNRDASASNAKPKEESVSVLVDFYYKPEPITDGRELRSLYYQDLADHNFAKYHLAKSLQFKLHEAMSYGLEHANSYSGMITVEELDFVRMLIQDVMQAQSKTMAGRELFVFSGAPEKLKSQLKAFDYLKMESLQNDMTRFPEKYLPKKTENYYEILGVSNVADTAEIKLKYRELSKLYHPDMNPDPAVVDKFLLIKEAYEVLSNSLKRKAFDATLKK
jgi:hypothetical protein